MRSDMPIGDWMSPVRLACDLCEYWTDALQRSVLFLDVLRQRGNNYLEHQQKGKPPILQFEYDTIIDGRKLPRPCNYALLKIRPLPDAPEDPTKRAYVVVDPRAGHGPGIGGSKTDSQVGVALRAGHPVYFVTFFPEPVPGQRLRDVALAEAQFLEEIARRHPRARGKPTLVGNCQAGWAVAVLAAAKPDLMGPIILSGAPLSYWSGKGNSNPMRYAGGLLGGKWVESLACDLGGGLFDGAHLVSNFENLDPANTLWKKYYNLYSKIDTEPARFLGFETWWGGYFLMNREEIDAIVSDLFIGNKLARQGIMTPDGFPVDLRNIRSPIVIFASFGDNITPPQQALNWIDDVYGDEQEIIDNDQTIVYLLHEDVGHLGIFVSGKVAAKEHAEIAGTLEMIDALPAGLYEMIIDRKHGGDRGTELEPTDYTVRFEARKLSDIRSLDDSRKEEGCFQTVDVVSRLADRWYRTFVGPWVQAMTPPQAAEAWRRWHPLRLQHRILSDANPMLAPLEAMAAVVRAQRRPVSKDNPYLAAERAASDALVAALDTYRDVRDTVGEGLFNMAYGPACLGTLFPPEPWVRRRTPAREVRSVGDGQFEAGGPLEAVLRIIALCVIELGVFDRRSARIVRALMDQSRFKDVDPQTLRETFKAQARLVRHDRERAITSLAVLLPTRNMRLKAVDVVRQVFMRAPDEVRMDHPVAARLAEVLELDLREVPFVPAGVEGAPAEVHATTAADDEAARRVPS